MIFILVVTPIIATFNNNGSSFDEQQRSIGAPLFDLSGISKIIPVVVFSLIFHHAIPSLSIEVSEKSKLSHVFAYTNILCGLLYGLVGIVGAWYFGYSVEESINLNWSPYHIVGYYRLSKTISFYVLIFPAIDVISAYPLNAICLASNLFGIVYRDTAGEMEASNQCLC